MQYILIENRGEIDPNALSLMGASSKREDSSKLGYFGSGNKYAMALLLRYNIPFKIYSGNNEIVIGTKDVPFRDKEFKQITINGESTSLTTEMGPGWEPWMILREYVQNSRDEDASNIVTHTEIVEPKEGYTRFYIGHTPEIEEVIKDWDRYFTFDRIDAIMENTDGKIFPNIGYKDQGLYLFKRGIRCYTGATVALYQYDMREFSLNESRVIENVYTASGIVSSYLCNYATPEIARNILRNAFGDKGYYEKDLDYYHYGINTLGAGWEEAIGNNAIVVADVSGFFIHIRQSKNCYLVSKEMARAIKKSFPDVEVHGLQDGADSVISKKVLVNPKMEYMLKKVQEFFTEIGYKITKDIEVVEFNVSSILGHAGKGYIEISEKVFDRGMKELAMVIMEEQEHITTGHADETRAFQDHLFRMWVTALEDKHGIFL